MPDHHTPASHAHDVNSTADYREALQTAVSMIQHAGEPSLTILLDDDLEQPWTLRRGPEAGRWVAERPAERRNPAAAARLLFDAQPEWPVPPSDSLDRAAKAMRAHDTTHPRRELAQAQADDADHPGPTFIG